MTGGTSYYLFVDGYGASSIGEIAKTAEEAAKIADTATQRTDASNQTIGQLGVVERGGVGHRAAPLQGSG
ncbi:MAG: hypothetical protein HC783_12800 [Rhodobacteraceae bacterium]|nr:hypothetical protein [Paracoccaceae bacterium]